ncbi:MAG: MAPEG family protein [Dongiaceae bacterium]
MIMFVTPIHAALLALRFVFLSVRVIGMRRKAEVSLGDCGNRDLMRRLRVHGNFAEYVPFAIVLMALAELQGGPIWAIHLMGIALTAGRLIHAYGVSQEPEWFRLRVLAMGLTFSVLIMGALANLGFAGLASLPVG